MDHLRECLCLFSPLSHSLSSACDQHQEEEEEDEKKQTGASLFSCVVCLYGSSNGANVQLSECFQHHDQRNFIVYTLSRPRDHLPPSLLPSRAPTDPPTPPAAGSADVTSIDKNGGVEMAL